MNGHTATAYFIGGAPRAGKTTLAKHFTSQTGLQRTSTDAIRTELRRTVLQSTEPALYYLDSLNADEANMSDLMRNHTDDIIAAADRESAVVWQTIEAFVRTNLKAGHNILIEGVAALPQFVAKLNIPYRAVFLGNESPHHAEIVWKNAAAHPESWLGKLQPDTVRAFAHFSQATSSHIKSTAKSFGLPYVDMGLDSYENQAAVALRHLLS
jgi:2-phosphoglycerate kinase